MDSFKTAPPSGTMPSDSARGNEALLAERMVSENLMNKKIDDQSKAEPGSTT